MKGKYNQLLKDNGLYVKKMILPLNTEMELTKRLEEGKSIICFGASSFAKKSLKKLDKLYERILFFVDNDEKKADTYIEIDSRKYNVYYYKNFEFEKINSDKVVILITSSYYSAIIEQLNRNQIFNKIEGFKVPFSIEDNLIPNTKEFFDNRITDVCKLRYKNIVTYQGKTEEYFEKKMEQVKKKFIIPNIGILLTTRCSLNCNQCLGLMPYFKEHYDIPIETFLDNLKLVIDAVDECVHVGISGGEVFLHKDLDKAIIGCVNENKIQEVVISTNGTIIPSEKILELLKNKKIVVNISNYGKIVNSAQLKALFDKNNITYIFNDDQAWIALGDNSFRNKSKGQLAHEYLRCGTGKHCKTTVDGKLFVCYRAAMQYCIQGYTNEQNYVELNTKTIAERKDRIYQLFMKEYAEICNYCDMAVDYPITTLPGVQMK